MANDRDNSGALFKNDRKDNDRHPDYKGQALIGGVEYWLSAWIKEPRAGGQKYMSLSLTPKQQQANAPLQPPRPKGNPRPLDDSIPF